MSVVCARTHAIHGPGGRCLDHAAASQLSCCFSTIPDPDPSESQLYAQQLETPNFVHTVSISQLDRICRHPSLPLLVNSAAFLKSQLPARLQNHMHRLQVCGGGTALGSMHALRAACHHTALAAAVASPAVCVVCGCTRSQLPCGAGTHAGLLPVLVLALCAACLGDVRLHPCAAQSVHWCIHTRPKQLLDWLAFALLPSSLLAGPQALPAPSHPGLQELLRTTIGSKAAGLEVSKDWRLVHTGGHSTVSGGRLLGKHMCIAHCVCAPSPTEPSAAAITRPVLHGTFTGLMGAAVRCTGVWLAAVGSIWPVPPPPHTAMCWCPAGTPAVGHARVTRPAPAGDLPGLTHFESHLATFREHLEAEVGRLTLTAQTLTESKGWWDNTQQVRTRGRALLFAPLQQRLRQDAAAAAAEAGCRSSSSSSTGATRCQAGSCGAGFCCSPASDGGCAAAHRPWTWGRAAAAPVC
jgi:hypothetical protein